MVDGCGFYCDDECYDRLMLWMWVGSDEDGRGEMVDINHLLLREGLDNGLWTDFQDSIRTNA